MRIGVVAVIVDGEPWRLVEVLGAAGANEPVFSVDPALGRVRFGDGVHGRAPPSGATVQIEFGPEGPTRPRYFDGQLLTAADFAAEQEYLLERHRRHNRLAHGWGVAEGLEVSIEAQDELCIAPGVAFTVLGDELVLECECCVPTPIPRRDPTAETAPQFVELVHVEYPIDPVPVGDEGEEFSRLSQSVAVRTTEKEGDGLAIARLLWSANGWFVDPTHKVRQLGRGG